MSDHILLCLGTVKGLAVLEAIAQVYPGERIWVTTFREVNVSKSYHEEISRLANEVGTHVVTLDEYKRSLIDIVNHYSIKKILCAGWRYRLPRVILQTLPDRVVIAHDSLLPKFRGFAPLPTAIIAGEKFTGVTFLLATDEVDAGDIVFQGRVEIGATDTIWEVIQKLLPIYRRGAELFATSWFTERIKQDDSEATYSVWRDELDYYVNWNEPAEVIERTVRALGFPYLGARTWFENKEMVIHRASIVPDIPFAIRYPGKVWKIDDHGRPIVICGSGLLRIDEATIDGESAIPFKRLRARLGSKA